LFEKHPNEFAAVILEPMNVEYPKNNFLKNVRELTKLNGALLIFDETITGFRYSNGGAQELFGVVPDLATFGKGIANGYPLSALVGRSEFMKVIEDIFFSGTFGGETLSLAAARAVLIKISQYPVLLSMKQHGEMLIEGVKKIIEELNLGEVISITGHPTWSFLMFKENSGFTSLEIKTFFIQEVFKRGVYTLGSHNLSYAHSKNDILILLNCYRDVFIKIASNISNGNLRDKLECDTLIPIFKVR
jgi:glutamate-1-semialdehyde aminotransferase